MSNIENINEPAWIPEDESLTETFSAAAHFRPLENRTELDAYVDYLAYRIQLDLYEAAKAAGVIKKWTWNEFVQALYSDNEGRVTVLMAAFLTLKKFLKKGWFNFGVTEVKLPDIKNEDLHSVKIFRDDIGRSYVENILIQAELAQYKRQLNRGKNYSWERYIDELTQDKQLWQETKRAFIDALLRLDFKTVAQRIVFE